MPTVFLSHSSSDKASYIDVVARKLGDANIQYDQLTFEEGEKTSDEITKGIEKCDVFALFISDAALKSKWVLDEISQAEKRLSAESLAKVYPIIIDLSINFKDARIPDWLRENYNLKLISRPTVAARRLEAKLRELHWSNHKTNQKRKEIFVGRNQLLDDFETRIDDVDQSRPACIIASGLTRIGRSKFLSHAIVKSNLVSSSFSPIKIMLDRVDSIEDFIIKLFDTGLTNSSSKDLENLLTIKIENKVRILSKMLLDVQSAKETLFVEDGGCVVSHSREIAGWFKDSIKAIKNISNPVLCIASAYRPNPAEVRREPLIYAVEIPELLPKERSGLLRRLLDVHQIEMSTDDFNFFALQLKGFPEEVFYCVNLILDLGIKGAKNEVNQLTEFNRERASLLLRQYEENVKVLDFIYLLSEFEFIGLEFLYQIVDEKLYQEILGELVARSICDYVGIEQEYVRLNDTIRDLIRRNRLGLPADFAKKIQDHVRDFVKDQNKFERDASDFFYSIKEAFLKNPDEINQKYLAPSHILRTIRQLYYKKENLKKAIRFCDLLLQKEAFLDYKIIEDTRYYLCLSLAKQKDNRVLKEVQKISGPEHDFILGHYYRLTGRHADAIERLSKLIQTPYINSRAKRELVQVYLAVEEYDKAEVMAKENYLANKGNQFPVQSYLNCLLNSENYTSHKDKIAELIKELEAIGSNQSTQMSYIANGLFKSKFEQNKANAFSCISDAIALDEDSQYPYFAQFDIALHYLDVPVMEASLSKLESISQHRTFSKNTLVMLKARLLAATGKIDNAVELVANKLDNFPMSSIERMKEKMIRIHEKVIAKSAAEK